MGKGNTGRRIVESYADETSENEDSGYTERTSDRLRSLTTPQDAGTSYDADELRERLRRRSRGGLAARRDAEPEAPR